MLIQHGWSFLQRIFLYFKLPTDVSKQSWGPPALLTLKSRRPAALNLGFVQWRSKEGRMSWQACPIIGSLQNETLLCFDLGSPCILGHGRDDSLAPKSAYCLVHHPFAPPLSLCLFPFGLLYLVNKLSTVLVDCARLGVYSSCVGAKASGGCVLIQCCSG
jgi:hypothetical protein